MSQPVRIFISVCEESADVHAASLVRAVRAAGHDWQFYGLTGPRLRELGVETVYDFAAHAAMLSGVLGLINKARRAIAAVEAAWRRQRPDVVVLLDSPELHLKLARRAKAAGIPVLYYIAPQTWASRAYRNRQIVRDIDRLACILPFEQDYFRGIKGSRDRGIEVAGIQGLRDSGIEGGARSRGFRAEYVGHPLFEALRREEARAGTMEFLRQRAGGKPIVALLPGSRRHVIETMLPMQLDVVRRMRAAGRDVHAVISCVAEEKRGLIREIVGRELMAAASAGASPPGVRLPGDRPEVGPPQGVGDGDVAGSSLADEGVIDVAVDVVVADNASLLTCADLVLVASGTAALHVAHYRKPMVVMYDAGRLLYWPYRLLGRLVIKAAHLSLVNILAGARVVPEFMPFIRDTAPIAAVAGQLLTDETWRRVMIRQIDEIVRPLEASTASARVCAMIGELLVRA